MPFSNGQNVQAADLNNFSVTTVTTSGAVAVGGALAVTGASTVAALTASGTVTPQGLVDASGAAAGQIKFPATQNASTNANTLDDYEEGTFTPTDASGAALSLATARGNYVKVGQLVVATIDVTYPATASGATASIGSLPFTAGSYGSVTLFGAAIAYTDYATPITAYCQASTAAIGFNTFGGVAITNANLTGLTVRATLTYRATA